MVIHVIAIYTTRHEHRGEGYRTPFFRWGVGASPSSALGKSLLGCSALIMVLLKPVPCVVCQDTGTGK